jgi:CHAT domain-containing protein
MTEWLRSIRALGDPGGLYRARGIGIYKGNAKPIEIRKKEMPAEVALAALANFLLPAQIRKGMVSIDRLFICPQRMLHRVPFHALPLDDNFLIEKFAISYLPNLRSLLYKDEEFSSDGGIVLVGTEHFDPGGDSVLANLSGAREEVEQLSKEYEARGLSVINLTGEEAKRETILAAGASGVLTNHDVIHIALHGEDVPTDNPLDARLFVRDGSIDGFDVSHWQLNAELVVLSACFAGVRAVAGRGLEYLPGDDLFGLQAAFFSAGARRVFGALWPVADQIGKELMVDFHRKLADHRPASAWQATIVAYLATAPASERSPQYWAPFFLVEEGREK